MSEMSRSSLAAGVPDVRAAGPRPREASSRGRAADVIVLCENAAPGVDAASGVEGWTMTTHPARAALTVLTAICVMLASTTSAGPPDVADRGS